MTENKLYYTGLVGLIETNKTIIRKLLVLTKFRKVCDLYCYLV